MEETDLLQIKIEKAKMQLSRDTLDAISAVPWQATILKMRETRGYSFEQLGDLETETELLLCGLLNPENYPKELENRMRITNEQANDLVKEMNDEVFSKIKEELIKISERKKTLPKSEITENDNQVLVKKEKDVLSSAGIEIIQPDLTIPELNSPLEEYSKGEVDKFPPRPDQSRSAPQEGNKIHPIMADKLADSVQSGTSRTEHTLENITKTEPAKTYPKGSDPYRLPPI